MEPTGILWLVVMLAVMAAILIARLIVRKSVKKLLASYLVIIGSFVMYAVYTCGPDPKDVAVMKPMAQKISDYIVKHGIPKSLEDIPDLPYRLEGCERSEEYFSYDDKRIINQGNIERLSIKEECSFLNIKVLLNITKWLKYDQSTEGSLELESKNRTFLHQTFGNAQGVKFKLDSQPLGKYISTGICNPMRQ